MNKIIKNKKIKLLFILLPILIIIPFKLSAKLSTSYNYNLDYELQQSLDGAYYINNNDGQGGYGHIVVKFKNEVVLYNGSATSDKGNYKLTDSGGNEISLLSISEPTDDDDYYLNYNNTQIYHYLNIYHNRDNYYKNIGDAVMLNIGSKLNGDYELCVKNIKSLSFENKVDSGHMIESGNPMQEECINFNASNKLVLAYPRYNGGSTFGDPVNGVIEVATNFVIGDGYGYGGNYVFKDSNNAPIDGSKINCYNNGGHPHIDSYGHPLGNIFKKDITQNNYWSDKSVMIDIGCPLPSGKYKICVSNIKDADGVLLSPEQCVDFSNTPILTSVTQIDGAMEAIKLKFDNSFEKKYSDDINYDIIIKDSNGNNLTLNDYQKDNLRSSYINSESNNLNFMNIDFTGYYASASYYDAGDIEGYVLPAGKYTVCVKNIRYNSESDYNINTIDNNIYDEAGQCKDIDIVDKVRPFLTKHSDEFSNGENYLAYDNNRIIIKYSEPMKESTVLDTRNYMIKDYDSNGDGVADVNSWTSINNIYGAQIYFDGSSYGKNVVIDLGKNKNINLIDGQTDIMIGNKESPDTHKITDLSGNRFVYTMNTEEDPILLPYAIGENITVTSNIDLSSEKYVQAVNILDKKTVSFQFYRGITSIDKGDFLISSSKFNGITPDSATIDSDSNVVIFTIGDAYNFDGSDTLKDIKLITKSSVTNSIDEYNLPFLSSSIFDGNLEHVQFINNLTPPEIQSAVMMTPDSIILGIKGEISPGSVTALSNSIIITQNINGVDKTIVCCGDGCNNVSGQCVKNNSDVFMAGLSGGGFTPPVSGCISFIPQIFYYDGKLNTTYFLGYIYGNNFANKDFIVKTKGSSNITFSYNGNKLKENTNGIVGHYKDLYLSDFFMTDGYTRAYITFSENIDKDTIVPNGNWEIFNANDSDLIYNGITKNDNIIRCNNASAGNCYIQKINNGVVFDLTSNKIFFPGTNIGYIQYNNNSYNVPQQVKSENLYVVFNRASNTLGLYFDYKNIDDEDEIGDIIYDYMDGAYYIPGDIRSLSGDQIDQNFSLAGYTSF